MPAKKNPKSSIQREPKNACYIKKKNLYHLTAYIKLVY